MTLFQTVPRHGSDILHRPDDVIGTKCGDRVELSCVARSTSSKTVVSVLYYTSLKYLIVQLLLAYSRAGTFL